MSRCSSVLAIPVGIPGQSKDAGNVPTETIPGVVHSYFYSYNKKKDYFDPATIQLTEIPLLTNFF